MRKRLTLAIFRLQKRRPRLGNPPQPVLNISNVAKEAGITPSTIHNVYPDIAEKIRTLMGKNSRAQRYEKHAELAKTKRINRALHEENTLLAWQLADLASENARLISENAAWKAESALNISPIETNKKN